MAAALQAAAAPALATISVVIPTLDEERGIAACLQGLLGPGIDLCVADGGSRDRTVAVVEGLGTARCVSTRRGRGPQMNAGADATHGDILLFLHADCRLPTGWAPAIRRAMTRPGAVGGFFQTHTRSPRRGRLFNLALRMADARSRLLWHPYGDSGIFVRREVFERLGGYHDVPIMEDYDFSTRLAKAGRLIRLDERIEVSARRFEAGLLEATTLMRVLPLLYHLGVSPERLDRVYRAVR